MQSDSDGNAVAASSPRANEGAASRVPCSQGNVRQASRRLAEAAATGVPCSPVRDLVGDDDTAAAYAVQKINIEDRVRQGARIVGRKIGLTSPAVQRQLGVSQPDFGVLLDDMHVAPGDVIPTTGLIQPRIEAEIAFVLTSDIDDPEVDGIQAVKYIDHAVACLEIVDSRIAGWDISFADTVADNASSARFVLSGQPVSLESFEPRAVKMQMFANDEVISAGDGTQCLGDPLNALAWLARTAIGFDDPLRAGQIVLSGALGPMTPVQAGTRVVADLTSLGSVDVFFA